MKVVFVGNDKTILSRGNGDAYARQREYARHFDRLTVIIFTLKSDGLAEKTVENLRIIPTNSASRWGYAGDAVRILGELREAEGVDLVSTQDPFVAGLVGVAAKLLWGTRLNVQLHNDFFASSYFRRESLQNYIFYWLGRFNLPFADTVRAVSRRLVKDGRYFVAPVPVDLDYFRRKKGPRHNKVKAKNRICRLVTVARLEKQKNIPLLLRAFYELRATGYELVVVGEGRERDRIEAEIKKLGLQDKVHLLGQKTREEVRRILWRADVFVLSSDYEGWGLAAVEALAAGVPVVMTDTGCAGEVIINNTTGRVVPKGDAEALTRAIREVRENPEEARKMVLAGQKLLEGQYKRGKLVRQFVAGFKHTL